ncbi:MAG TPA: FAD-binding protein [Proteobacteria bacterium]|nr:FAD-binding protein [Pseudomonadota bacterium]
MEKVSYLVLGGGLAGITAAYILSQKGIDSVVVESESEIGGLARTVRFGEFRYDIGGHRIFSDNPAVLKWIKDILGDSAVEVSRQSRIYMRGQFFHYPVRPLNALFRFGLPTSLKILATYLSARLKGAADSDETSFEDWVKSRFGSELYNLYFKPYTEKLWGIDCTELSSDWAKARISVVSLTHAIRRAVLPVGKVPRTYAPSFLYPKGGISTLIELIAQGATRARIMTDCRPTRIAHDGKRITSVEVRTADGTVGFEPENVISSIPIDELVRLLDPQPDSAVIADAGRLEYRALVCLFVTIDRPQVTKDNWIYFSEKRFPFARMHEPKNWDRSMSPPDKTSVCLEFFCSKGDATWNATEEELASSSLPLLAEAGFFKLDEVESRHITRIPHAYPILKLGYKAKRRRVLDELEKLANLKLVGRTGTFTYYNMDHVIEQVFEVLKTA